MQEVANQEFAARNPDCNIKISAACESSFAPYRDFPSTPRSPIFQWPRFSYLLTKLITTVFNPGIPFAQYGSGTPNSKSAWNPLNMTVGLSKPLGEVSTLTRFVTSWSKDHNCFRDDLTSKSVKVATCFWPQKWYCALYTPSGGLTGLVWLDWFDVDFFRKPWFWPTIYIYIYQKSSDITVSCVKPLFPAKPIFIQFCDGQPSSPQVFSAKGRLGAHPLPPSWVFETRQTRRPKAAWLRTGFPMDYSLETFMCSWCSKPPIYKG